MKICQQNVYFLLRFNGISGFVKNTFHLKTAQKNSIRISYLGKSKPGTEIWPFVCRNRNLILLYRKSRTFKLYISCGLSNQFSNYTLWILNFSNPQLLISLNWIMIDRIIGNANLKSRWQQGHENYYVERGNYFLNCVLTPTTVVPLWTPKTSNFESIFNIKMIIIIIIQ